MLRRRTSAPAARADTRGPRGRTCCAPGTPPPPPPGLLGPAASWSLSWLPWGWPRASCSGQTEAVRLVLAASPFLPCSGAPDSVLGDRGAAGGLISGPRSWGKIPGPLGGLGRTDPEPHRDTPRHECLQEDPFSPGPPTESSLRGGPRPAPRLQHQARMGPGGEAARRPHHLHRGHPGPPHAGPGGLGPQRHVRIPGADGPELGPEGERGPLVPRRKQALGEVLMVQSWAGSHLLPAHLWARTPEPWSQRPPWQRTARRSSWSWAAQGGCERDGIMTGRKTWKDSREPMPREASRTRRTVWILTAASRGDQLGRT